MTAAVRNIVRDLHRSRAIVFVGLAVMCLIMAGCAEVNYLRDAQSSFSDAARMENNRGSKPVSPTETSGLLTESDIRAGYTSAIASIDQLNNEQIESLKSDKLWGVVLTIKAMSYWRLGDYDSMQKVVTQATSLQDDQIYPRDKAILMALPGLRRVDEAVALLAFEIKAGDKRQQAEKIMEAVTRLVSNASTIFTKARQTSPQGHPVRVYLLQCELAGYKNLLDGRNRLTGGGLDEKEREKVKQLLAELDCSLKESLQNSDDQSAVRQNVVMTWQIRFGLFGTSCKQ